MKAINDIETFATAHRDDNEKLRVWATTKAGRAALNRDHFEALLDRSAMSLTATNAKARIVFCKAAIAILPTAVRASSEQPASFVTLAPSWGWMTRLEAQQFDWSQLQHWARQLLAGFCYFGAVDLAMYANGRIRDIAKPISWHLHVIVWDATFEQIGRLVDQVNADNDEVLPGMQAAHARSLKGQKGVIAKTTYLMKAPLRRYSAIASVDRNGRPTGQWNQKKDARRPGEAALVVRLLHGSSLPDLCIEHHGAEIAIKLEADALKRLSN